MISEHELEIWINHVGFGLFSSVQDQDLATISQKVEVNVKALPLFSTLFFKSYQETQGTQLLNVSSGVGYSLYFYTTSKFFVSNFTENLAYELQSKQAELVVPKALSQSLDG